MTLNIYMVDIYISLYTIVFMLNVVYAKYG